MDVKFARKLEDIDFTLDNKPLNENNFADYYVQTKEARGEDPTSKLVKKIRKMQHQNPKILFSGFKGCGKSTELFKLKQELDDRFLTRIFSVLDKLDPNNLTISEILISITKDLVDLVHENYDKIRLSEELIENLDKWGQKVYQETTDYKYIEGKLATGLDIKAGLGKILNLFARLGFDFNAGRKFQEITKKEVPQTLAELILNCNLLVSEIKNQLDKINKCNIIFIVEDLEKVPLPTAEELFFTYARQLTSISSIFIYTFPISLVYHQKYTVIIQEFDVNIVLPMIKVHDKNQKDYGPGISSITDILHRRIDSDLIMPGLLEKFIRMSGGCLRDLFRMIKFAAENAIESENKAVEETDFQYSLNRLKNDYYNAISYNEQTGMTAEEYYKILSDCCSSPDKKPDDVKGLIDLKHNLCILGYNGETWFDVHPVVKELLRDKGRI